MHTTQSYNKTIAALSEILGGDKVEALKSKAIFLTKRNIVDYLSLQLNNSRCTVVNKVVLYNKSNNDEIEEVESKDCEVFYTKLAGSFMTSKFDKVDGCESVKIENGEGNEGYQTTIGKSGAHDFSNDMIVVKIIDDSLLNSVKSYGIYLDTLNNKVYTKTYSNDELILHLDGVKEVVGRVDEDGNVISREKVNQDIIDRSILYVPFIWSAGQKKSNQSYFINANKYDASKRYDFLNAMTGNTLDGKIEETLKSNNYISDKALEKLTSRFSLFATKAIEFGTYATKSDGDNFTNSDFGVLYVNEKFKGAADKLANSASASKELKALINSISREIIDGASIVSNKSIAAILLSSFNVLIDPENVIGLDLQMRTMTVNSKTFATVDEHEAIQRLVEFIKGKFEGCYTIFGNPANIGMVLDANAAKMVPNTGSNFTNYLLDIARPNNASSSAQAFEIFRHKAGKLGQLNKLDNFIYKAAKENAEKKIDAMLNQKLNSKASAENHLLAINKSVALTDTVAMSKFVKSVDMMNISTSTKNKIGFKGFTYRALFEGTFLWGQGLIGNILNADDKFVYAYSGHILKVKAPAINEIYKTWVKEVKEADGDKDKIKAAKEKRTESLDNILSGEIIKYPAISNPESGTIRCLTAFEIKERFARAARIAKIDKNDPRVQDALKAFLNRGDGSIILAPINLIKNKHAGMDTDYDSVVVFFEKELVDIALEYKAKFGEDMTLITEDGIVEEVEVEFEEESLNACNENDEEIIDFDSLFSIDI